MQKGKSSLRMPAEWEPHEATWITWPKNTETFGEMLPRVQNAFILMISTLAQNEKVRLVVGDDADEAKVRKMLDKIGASKNVFFFQAKACDVWIRDYGPIFVKDRNEVIATKWIYNAYGNKYSDLAEDTHVFDNIIPGLGLKTLYPEIVLEGGSIEVNGKGSLLTTEQCLLAKSRNPKLTKEQIEGSLGEYLGARNVIWLKEGVVGDDTDGHIDDIARFVDERTILCAYEDDKSDANYHALKKNFEALGRAVDQDGEKFEVEKLPMPRPVISLTGRLPASYANFYIANKSVFLPVFGDKNDKRAISVLETHFPDRAVIPIDCIAWVHGLGSIHCSTQQQPR